jgi:NAD(P)-dependent dehydrogenase (short-subunit alcohol dehydrogenase family)
MSIFDLTGRTAVITGGNGGIGLGIAQALNAQGCNVSIWGRNAEKNKGAAATMSGGPGKVHTQVCDVSDPASVKAAMQATLDTFGRVDGCFANAGIGSGGRRAFIDRTEEEWRRMFATNLDGVFHVFQAAARHMTERAEAGDKFGRLVATSSLASLFGTARNEHYAGTKAALNALCRALAEREIRRQRDAADSGPPVRRADGFWRHRGVHHEQGVVVSYSGLLCDRRRVHGVLRRYRLHPPLEGTDRFA